MKASKEYIIEFAGLSVGEHLYELNVNDKFFENLDYSEIKQGDILVKVTMLKQSSMMVLHFDISGTVKLICDRCATDFDLPIIGSNKLIVKVGGNFEKSDDDDIICIADNEHKIDLTQFIYEYIILSIPIKRMHSDEKDCDKVALDKLSTLKGEEEGTGNKETKTDPRWDILKDVKLN
jgi:uncharacterized metal-binding protein YceD (DUF177 family)